MKYHTINNTIVTLQGTIKYLLIVEYILFMRAFSIYQYNFFNLYIFHMTLDSYLFEIYQLYLQVGVKLRPDMERFSERPPDQIQLQVKWWVFFKNLYMGLWKILAIRPSYQRPTCRKSWYVYYGICKAINNVANFILNPFLRLIHF